MPTIDEDFAVLASEMVSTFGPNSGAATGTLLRATGGTFDPATGTETGETSYALAVGYVRRGANRMEARAGGSGDGVRVERVEYLVTAAEIAAGTGTWPTGADAEPREDDRFTEAASPHGDGKTRRIVGVRRETLDKVYILECEGPRST